MAVFQFIEGFYNPSRRHSALRKLHMLADYVPIEWDGKRIRSVGGRIVRMVAQSSRGKTIR